MQGGCPGPSAATSQAAGARITRPRVQVSIGVYDCPACRPGPVQTGSSGLLFEPRTVKVESGDHLRFAHNPPLLVMSKAGFRCPSSPGQGYFDVGSLCLPSPSGRFQREHRDQRVLVRRAEPGCRRIMAPSSFRSQRCGMDLVIQRVPPKCVVPGNGRGALSSPAYFIDPAMVAQPAGDRWRGRGPLAPASRAKLR